MSKSWHLVAYDIRDEKRLRRAAKKLLGFGHRVQYSVFRCRLSERDLERMHWELSKIMEEEDTILIIGLCDACAERLRSRTGDDAWATSVKQYRII
jgi:CRISPR-associated protein Cas2